MTTQTGNRSCRRGRARLFLLAIGAMSLPMIGCAEIELGAQTYKNLGGANAQPPVQTPGQPPAQPASTRPDSIERSLQSDPEAFLATGIAVWDGVRTLPGIWIAHPMAAIARRVRLTNNQTGVRADAAMFQRDPNLSGPRIIVSSAAAEALGLAPGHATPITIEGLTYRVEPEIAAVEVEQADPAPADVSAQVTTAELAALDVAPVAATSPAPPTASVSVAPDSATQESATPEPAPPESATPESATPESAAPESANLELAASDEAVLQPEPAASGTDAGGTDAGGPDIVATGEAKATTEEVLPVISAPAPLPVVRPADRAPVAAGDITDGRHFIQAGVFGQPENATRLVAKLRAADLPVSERPLTAGERQLTRVLVGPFQTEAERDTALESVREIGPADAAPVRG